VIKGRRLKLEDHQVPLPEKCIQKFDRETLRVEITWEIRVQGDDIKMDGK